MLRCLEEIGQRWCLGVCYSLLSRKWNGKCLLHSLTELLPGQSVHAKSWHTQRAIAKVAQEMCGSGLQSRVPEAEAG